MEPLLETKQTLYHLQYDSVSDLIDTVRRLNPEREAEKYRRSSRAAFIGRPFKNLMEACDAIEQPWDEGLRAYTNIKNQLADSEIPPPSSLKRQRCWDEDSGSEISVDRLQEGNPYWSSSKRHHRPGPVSITLLSAITISGSEDWERVLWRSAATICLTELLESSGYRCEVSFINSVTEGYVNGFAGLTTVKVKYGSDPLDISTLINIGSGWAFRTVWFASDYLPPVEPSEGLGYPCSFVGHIPAITPDEQVIVCEDVWEHSSAVRWIRGELEKLK